MPYYIYRMTEQPVRILKKIEEYANYRDAAARVKLLRADLPPGTNAVIKMMHAETELHAEDLLNEVRVPEPELGDD